MHKVWIIARNEYLVNLRRPGFLITTAIFPLIGLAILIIGAAFGGQAGAFLEQSFEPQTGRIGVVDQSGLFTPILPEYDGKFLPYADAAAGQAALRAGETDALLVFPADYLASGSVKVNVIGSGFSGAVLQDSDGTRMFILDHLLRGKMEDTLRVRAEIPMVMQLEALSAAGGQSTSGEGASFVASFVVPYMISLFLVISIFASSGYLLQSVAEEKENRVMEIILSSVSAPQLMAGKIIGLGALGLTQILIWLVSAWALSRGATELLSFNIPLLARIDILVLAVVYYLLGYSLFAVLMTTAGSLGTSQRESQQIAGLFSFSAAIPYMISGFLFANPDVLLGRIFSWIPLTAPTMMMLRLPLSNNLPLMDIAISIAGLLITIPLTLWAGAKIFRMGLLMYGKRPDLRQIWNALRQA
jgi:ABC-2 type transport system permease protein